VVNSPKQVGSTIIEWVLIALVLNSLSYLQIDFTAVTVAVTEEYS
jgi:hypothetical protein